MGRRKRVAGRDRSVILHADDDVVMRFEDYPIPPRWKRVVDEPSPVQATFHQAGWLVPG